MKSPPATLEELADFFFRAANFLFRPVNSPKEVPIFPTQLCTRRGFQLLPMKSFWRPTLALALLGGALAFAGCGGGGGGTSMPSPTPTATPRGTPINGNTILVRLFDSSGLSADGVVSLAVGINTYRLGTTGGQATFVGFAAGTYSLSAQVNGQTQTRPVAVGNGATTVDFSFAAGVTPTATGTIPSPPFS